MAKKKKDLRNINWNNLLISTKSKQIIKELKDYRLSLEIVKDEVALIKEELEEIYSIVDDFDELEQEVSWFEDEHEEFWNKIDKLSPDSLDNFLQKLQSSLKKVKKLKKETLVKNKGDLKRTATSQ